MSRNIIILGLLLLFSTEISKADSWVSYSTKEYFSENRKYKLIIIPTFIPEKYYEWMNFKRTKSTPNKRNDRKRAKFIKTVTEKDTTLIPCHGKLFCITGTDTVLIWKRKLINKICPVFAIVSNDGSSITTFDNWFSNGYGENVMVVYNENGDLKKTYSLEDISPYSLNDYLRSISSIWWSSGQKYIDNENVEIEFYTEKKETTKRIYNTKHLEFEK